MKKKVRIDKERYSESSKRSAGHEFLGEYYEDLEYECVKCHKKAVFLAQDRKDAYEQRKVYMWKKRNLCGLCWENFTKIRDRLIALDREYGSVKKDKTPKTDVLTEWLELLNQYPKFGKKSDIGKIHAIKKILENT